jgi:hypothetical protein
LKGGQGGFLILRSPKRLDCNQDKGHALLTPFHKGAGRGSQIGDKGISIAKEMGRRPEDYEEAGHDDDEKKAIIILPTVLE